MRHIKKLTLIISISMILLSIISVNGIETNKQKITNINSTSDIELTVEIQKIRSLEKEDPQVNAKEEIDTSSDPDFYLKIYINNEEFTSEIWHNTKYIYNPEFTPSTNIPTNEEYINIKIQLWDYADEHNTDRLCDISGDTGNSDDSYDIELIYNIKTGHWTGDDFPNSDLQGYDPSGYGRLNGCDDGTIYTIDRDCELWFDIYQNDEDGDKIPDWIETNVYGTDPEVDNTGDDIDDDGVPIEWEHKWGYDPLTADNHASLDPDNDGINNVEEYLTSQWFSDPYRRDLFVELDQMEDGPNGETSRLPEGSKEILYTAYDRNNVVYHLDDGSWGEGSGSDMIPFDPVTECSWGEHDELDQLYEQYYLENNQNEWRKGVFHYGIVIYQSSIVNGNMFGSNRYQISAKGMEEKYNSLPWLDRDIVYASAYMHEMGHTLSFWPVPGHNGQAYWPWQIGWWMARPYKSCMNYGYMYTTVDYSDGSRSINDYNDWERMDLTSFQRGV
jgi:hypothetical protein